MKLAIVGSSRLSRKQLDNATLLVYGLVLFFQKEFAKGKLEIVSGGATGVDSIAKGVADDYGFAYTEFAPQVKLWKGIWIDGVHLKGFKDRNLEIASYCDSLVCIRYRDSNTYGSGWTADRAVEMGKLVARYYV